jgi:DNA adenine methylase
MNPLFRWAGSKRKILPTLETFWKPTYDRYVEPFVGCAALFFRVQPKQAVLGDLNEELITTYQTIRDHPDEVYTAATALPISKDAYYQVRSVNPVGLHPLARAVRFTYLNRLCFNGIYRTNLQGHFNVPYCGARRSTFPAITEFRKCALSLKRADIKHCDFGHIIDDTKSGDFVYLDPPYALKSRRVFRQYGPKDFDESDLSRLGDHLKKMHDRGVHFVVSYADCAESRRLLKNWKPRRIRVRRNVAGFASSRRTTYELLATNIII